MDNLFYKGYCAELNKNDDGTFTGKVIFISDLVLFHGNNIEEAKYNFKISVDEYIDLLNNIRNLEGDFNDEGK